MLANLETTNRFRGAFPISAVRQLESNEPPALSALSATLCTRCSASPAAAPQHIDDFPITVMTGCAFLIWQANPPPS